VNETTALHKSGSDGFGEIAANDIRITQPALHLKDL
jgi:hypothetical protein